MAISRMTQGAAGKTWGIVIRMPYMIMIINYSVRTAFLPSADSINSRNIAQKSIEVIVKITLATCMKAP